MHKEKLVLAIKRLIEKHFSESDWEELGYLTSSREIINSHPRLLRSLSFGDNDYGSCIFSVIEEIIAKDDKNTRIIIDFIDLEDYLKKEDPDNYNLLFGHIGDWLNKASITAVKNSFDLNQHISRINKSIESDPELAIGSMKDLVESVFKTILNGMSVPFCKSENFNELLKMVQKSLKLDPTDRDQNAKGAQTIKRILSNLGQVIVGIDEIRNFYGTGHGRIKASGISNRHAKLVVGSGATLAIFLMETFELHKKSTGF